MTQEVDNVNLITAMNMNEYFNDAIQTAVAHQHLSRNDDTIVYIVNMLSHFSLSDNIYDGDESEGRSVKPLAFIYKDAVEANSDEERIQCLRKLGDVALFIAGFYSESLNRSMVGINYFASMGGNAYSSLADNVQRSAYYKAFGEVFSDLAEHFMAYVDVLMEVRDSTEVKQPSSILCLYESWLSTGSDYARKRLQENGILTFPVGQQTH